MSDAPRFPHSDGGRLHRQPSVFRAPLVQMSHAVVVRGGNPILRVDAFELEQGENIALLGPNGSGKSTFVNLITRDVLPLHRDDPPVLFKGCARATLSEIRGSIGVVSSTMQDQMAVHLPVLDIVAGGLFGAVGIPRRVPLSARDDAYGRSRAALGLLGIDHLADRDVMTLSTGQARRVLIARAFVHAPEALVLDEPCAGLDPEGMYHVRASMRAMVREGTSIVLVTHHPEDIIPEISRLVLIKDGAVFADGPKETLLSDETMQTLFEVPVKINRSGRYYSLVSAY